MTNQLKCGKIDKMRKVICPITKKVFDCRNCEAIVDGEKCRYMVRDEIAEQDFKFVRKILEKEFKDRREI